MALLLRALLARFWRQYTAFKEFHDKTLHDKLKIPTDVLIQVY